MKTVHIFVEGKVQGVWFREYTRQQAEALGLGGWVRNLPDGRVEALICGEPEPVSQMITWFNTGSPHSRVDRVITEEALQESTFTTFTITL